MEEEPKGRWNLRLGVCCGFQEGKKEHTNGGQPGAGRALGRWLLRSCTAPALAPGVSTLKSGYPAA